MLMGDFNAVANPQIDKIPQIKSWGELTKVFLYIYSSTGADGGCLTSTEYRCEELYLLFHKQRFLD